MKEAQQDEIEVKLAGRAYPIIVRNGLRHSLGELARSAFSARTGKLAVISNARIFGHYGDEVMASLRAANFQVSQFLIGDGERFKTLRTAEKVFSFLIEQQLERADSVIALGGGIVGDLAGFAAAAYLRGIDYIQVPTTLLAQIDSSIGGKTGVNHKLGKNLIGAFHQPRLVAIDPETLATLPARELSAALQEAVKYGVIADQQLFTLIENGRDELRRAERGILHEIILRCCAIKAGVVSRDERESGERRILNFGHTIGHALEAATNYRRFKHGEAVGYGILGATKIATLMDLLSPSDADRINRAVAGCGRLPTAHDISIDSIMQSMSKDKKSIAGQLTFILPDRIGHVIIREAVPLSLIHKALTTTLKEGNGL
jgi:3-dehydroquinate synthase